MRIVTSTADLAYPYILFNFIDYEKSFVQYDFMGCIEVLNSKTYNLKLSIIELKNYSVNNWNMIRSNVDNNKIRIASEINSKECNI